MLQLNINKETIEQILLRIIRFYKKVILGCLYLRIAS